MVITMQNNATLTMPANYIAVDSEEMTYVEGGWDYSIRGNVIDVPMKAMYLSKLQCLAFASYIVGAHGNFWSAFGMDRTRIATELYAHALAYYSTSTLKALGVSNATINKVNKSGSVANIDKGDSMAALYYVWWACT
jgi:hypothetical protein